MLKGLILFSALATAGQAAGDADTSAYTPVTGGSGATLTVCTDESNVVRTLEGDVAACREKGRD
jgi:hypothetical protein